MTHARNEARMTTESVTRLATGSKPGPSNSGIVFTPAARRAQGRRGSAHLYEKRMLAGFPDRITRELAAFVADLDTAFLATVSAAGAPYIQHRGGPKGFIKASTSGRWASPTTPATGSTSPSATSPRTTAPFSSCSTSPLGGGSRSGGVRA
jgi:hypothetical protein